MEDSSLVVRPIKSFIRPPISSRIAGGTGETPPVPGGDGVITIVDAHVTSVSMTWVTATDAETPVAALQYKVYYSTTDNISGATNVEANGITAVDWTAALVSAVVTSLSPNTTYYFNALVKDAAGSKVAYISVEQATDADTTPPTPGNAGTITQFSVTATNIPFSWAAATDDATPQPLLQYKVYYSLSDNISGVANVEANGITAVDWTANLLTATAEGLNPDTTYYMNVLVRDLSANKAAYISLGYSTTADTVAPTPGDSGNITHGDAVATSIAFSWATGVDNVTIPVHLIYKAYYSLSDNISGVANVEANGTMAVDWTTAITATTAEGLTPDTTYYLNVLIKDLSGNIAAYTSTSYSTTADTAPPTPGNGGVIVPSLADAVNIPLSWTTAIDNAIAPGLLQYKVYYSLSDNISGVANVEANGTMAVDWTTGITAATAENLTPSTTYYLNVLVQDLSANKSAYISTTSATTAAGDPPVPGNSGILTASTLTNTSVNLTWTTATDTVTPAGSLQYKVYYSLSDNISGAINVEANGTTAVNWTAAITATTISGLNADTTYYTNVLVKDGSNNKVAYISTSVKTCVVYDTFNRADADALGVADTGQTWSIIPGLSPARGLYIRSNQAKALQASYQFSVLNSTKSDARLSVTVLTKTTYGGMVFRAVNWGNNFTLWYGGGYTQYHVYEVGARGLLGVSAINPQDGDLIEVLCSGTSIKIYINGVLALDLTSSFNQTTTSHGIIAVGAGVIYDNYKVVGV